MRRGRAGFLPRRFFAPEYRFCEAGILSAEVFDLERRREGSAGALFLSLAVILTALIAWLLWERAFGADEPSASAVLIHRTEEEYIHG